nr:MAG TPA: hypothetical protein [Caudoviricetes sp.]
MATKNKIGLQIDLETVISRLEKANKNVKKGIEEMLIESKQAVTQNLEKDTIKQNFPAKGIYSVGTLKESIDRTDTVDWKGMTAEIKVGYDMNISGMESVYLLYGTPKMNKVQKLYNDIYGSRTKKIIAEIQQNKLNEILGR